jgi:hypothetical protein
MNQYNKQFYILWKSGHVVWKKIYCIHNAIFWYIMLCITCRNLPSFRKNVLPPSSRSKSESCKNQQAAKFTFEPEFLLRHEEMQSRDSSVGIATSWKTGNRFFVGARDFFVLHNIHMTSEAHLASYPIGTVGSFPGVKRPGFEAEHSLSSSA